MARTTRRTFLQTAGLAIVSSSSSSLSWSADRKPAGKKTPVAVPAKIEVSPQDRLNIGLIGAWGRGRANAGGVLSDPGVQIVALCDVDDQKLALSAKMVEDARKQPCQAKTYNDWRKMLDQKDIDAVIVSTPDHHHALASVAAMQRGKHVYCEKPLAHSVHEARRVQEAFKQSKVATQMGTQIHATDNYRRVVELVQSGAIGAVKEAHVWCSRVGFKAGTKRPTDTPDVPPNLHWDLWLGVAPQRPFHPSYMGGCTVWEQWWDFGNGCLGDMGSHLIDLPFWALGLRQPTSVEAEGSHRCPDLYPEWLTARWEHPATKDRPGLTLCWYDGGKRPESPPGVDLTKWGNGILFVGEKGQLLADYNRRILLPEEKFKDFTPPKETIPKSLGHYAEWLHACRTGAPTLCNFDYSGMLVEHNLLGVVAFRTGKKLQWQPDQMKAAGCPEADQFIRREYRPGWSIG